ncbi:MAG: hypothetical protein HY821_20085 [Acidobacteria bacterium]|nr:hypothetical protein [Acidobacteriota bacterium]
MKLFLAALPLCLAASAATAVKAPGISAVIGGNGIESITAGGARRAVTGVTAIDGLIAVAGRVSEQNGVVLLERTFQGAARQARVTERFSAGRNSIRWEVEIRGDGAPWTAPVHTRIGYPAAAGTKFWTAWSDPVAPPDGKPLKKWSDPLRLRPPETRRLWYGAPYFTYGQPGIGFCPFSGDLLAMPIASYFEPARDFGLSVVLSPEGEWFDLTLDTTAQGQSDFARHYHRLGGGAVMRFALDLAVHEADWRGGLRWMAERYPQWFEPKLAFAHELSGTSAYSATEAPFDAGKMKRMAFRTNWKASFDFPYMGMFLPPVDEGQWPRFTTKQKTYTSIRQMAEYSEKMRAGGFHVLNYFNVTEFGAHVSNPPAAPQGLPPDELWKNGDDFLYGRLRGAILPVPDAVKPETVKFDRRLHAGGPYYTWEGGIVTDAGEPAYKEFLLDQARRHVAKLPASSGICIDRMDWLRMYNENRDDGASWFGQKATRSLYWSWRGLMAELLPVFHNAGKTVFVNNHLKRLDLLKDIDGIFDEFTYNAAALNTTALLTLKRPALGWTGEEKQVREDPDGFFQRFLYMGVFPMAPFPGNDHSLMPSEWVDAQYLAYGPLMNAMRGRVWVLTPHAIEVVQGQAAANLFAVPGGGYVAPVMMGGAETRAVVLLRGVPGRQLRAEALLPGAASPSTVRVTKRNGGWELAVPLARGCAMVRIVAAE